MTALFAQYPVAAPIILDSVFNTGAHSSKLDRLLNRLTTDQAGKIYMRSTTIIGAEVPKMSPKIFSRAPYPLVHVLAHYCTRCTALTAPRKSKHLQQKTSHARLSLAHPVFEINPTHGAPLQTLESR